MNGCMRKRGKGYPSSAHQHEKYKITKLNLDKKNVLFIEKKKKKKKDKKKKKKKKSTARVKDEVKSAFTH